MYDDLYGVQDIRGSTSVDLSKGIVVCPLLSFLFSFSLFSIFFYFFGGLNGSFYLTLICPLWDLLNFDLFGIFSSLRGNTLFYKKYRRSFTLYKSTQHKEEAIIMC